MVCVFDSHGLPILRRKLVAQLIAKISLVADVAHGQYEIAVIILSIDADHAIVALKAADRSIGLGLKLPAKM